MGIVEISFSSSSDERSASRAAAALYAPAFSRSPCPERSVDQA